MNNEREPVFIVGGGPSLKDFPFEKLRDKNTIVVNKAIFDVPMPNYFVTVDYMFLRKCRNKVSQFKEIPTTKVFVADMHYPFMIEQNGQIVDTRFSLAYDLVNFDVILKSKKAKGIGGTFDDFRTGVNSGFCALQLAVVLGYVKIYLLGIDMCYDSGDEGTHYHSGYGENKIKFKKKLDIYLDYFRSGLIDLRHSKIKVISCSPNSPLNKVIDYVPYKEVL